MIGIGTICAEISGSNTDPIPKAECSTKLCTFYCKYLVFFPQCDNDRQNNDILKLKTKFKIMPISVRKITKTKKRERAGDDLPFL